MRTEATEAELVDLQRKALVLFWRADNLADRLGNRGGSQALIDETDAIAEIAREVSDAVDELADYIRRSRQKAKGAGA